MGRFVEYFLLVLAVACIAGQFSTNKVYQKKFVSGLADMLFFPFMSGAVNVLFFTLLGFFLYGGLPHFSVFSLFISIAIAFVSTSSCLIGILIMKYGKMAVYSVFMMLGGMILPYFYGVLFLGETVSAARIAGLAILICALPCSAVNPDKSGKQAETSQPPFFYFLCILIFILNGCMSILSKAHSINDAAVPAANLLVYTNLWQTVINGAAFFIFTRILKKTTTPGNTPQAGQVKPQAVLTIAVFAVVSGVGGLFLLIAAESVPAVMLYPFVTGGSIVLSTLAARIFFKEKLSPLALTGIIMSFAGTLLFLIT